MVYKMEDADFMEDSEIAAVIADRELNRLKNAHSNTGYREGITDGQERALQKGFNDGFRDAGNMYMMTSKLRGALSAMLVYFKMTKRFTTEKLIEDLETLLEELKQLEACEPEIIKEHFNEVLDSQQNKLKQKKKVNVEDIQDVEMLLDSFNLTDSKTASESQTVTKCHGDEKSIGCCSEESCEKDSQSNNCSCHCEAKQSIKQTERSKIKLNNFVDIDQGWGKIETLLKRHNIPQSVINQLGNSITGIDK